MAKFTYSGSNNEALENFPKWSSNIFIILKNLLNSNARGTKNHKYLDPQPFYNKWGVGYSDENLPANSDTTNIDEEYAYARTDALNVGVENLDYTAGNYGKNDNIIPPSSATTNEDIKKEWTNIINLLMPQYARRVEVEDLDKNFWVIGVTLDCIVNALWGKGNSIVETILDIIQELIDIRNMIGGTDILEVSMQIGANNIKNLYENMPLYESKVLLKSENSIRDVSIPIVHFNSNIASKNSDNYIDTYKNNSPIDWSGVCKIYNDITIKNNNNLKNSPSLSDSDLFFTDKKNVNEQLTFMIDFDKIYTSDYTINKYYVDQSKRNNEELRRLVSINQTSGAKSELTTNYGSNIDKQYGEKLKNIKITYYNLENIDSFKNATNIDNMNEILSDFFTTEENFYLEGRELNCIQLTNENGYSTVRSYISEAQIGDDVHKYYTNKDGKSQSTIEFNGNGAKIIYNNYKIFNHAGFQKKYGIDKSDTFVLTDFDKLDDFPLDKCSVDKKNNHIEILNPTSRQCLIFEYHETNFKEGYTQKFWKNYVEPILIKQSSFDNKEITHVGNLYDTTLFVNTQKIEDAEITEAITIGTENGWMVTTRDEELYNNGTISEVRRKEILQYFKNANNNANNLNSDFKYFSLGSQQGVDIMYWSGNYQINNMIDSSLNYAYVVMSYDNKAISKTLYMDKIVSPGLYYDDEDWELSDAAKESNAVRHQMRAETITSLSSDTLSSHLETIQNDDGGMSVVGKEFSSDSSVIVWPTKYSYNENDYISEFINYKYIVEFTSLFYGDGQGTEQDIVGYGGIYFSPDMQKAKIQTTFGKSVQDNGNLLTQRLYNIYETWQTSKSNVPSVGELISLGVGDNYRLPQEAYLILYGSYDNDNNSIDRSYKLGLIDNSTYALTRIADTDSDISEITYKFPNNCLFLQTPDLYNYEIVAITLGQENYNKYLDLKKLPSTGTKQTTVSEKIDDNSNIISTLQLQNNFGVNGYRGELQTYNMSANIGFYQTNSVKSNNNAQGLRLTYFIPEIRNYKNYTPSVNYYQPEISVFTKSSDDYTYIPKQLQLIQLLSEDLSKTDGNILVNEISISGENGYCDSFAGGGYMRNNKCIHSFSNLFVKNSTTVISNDNSIHLGENLPNLSIEQLSRLCMPTYSYNDTSMVEKLNEYVNDYNGTIKLSNIFTNKRDIIATSENVTSTSLYSNYSIMLNLLKKYNKLSESKNRNEMLNLIETLLASITYYYRNVIDLGIVRLVSNRVAKPVNITKIACEGAIGGNAYRNATHYMLIGLKRKDIDNDKLNGSDNLYPGKLEIVKLGVTGLNTDTADSTNNITKYVNVTTKNWDISSSEGTTEQNLGYGQKYVGYILLLWSQYIHSEVDGNLISAGSQLAQVRNLRLYGETTPGYIIF